MAHNLFTEVYDFCIDTLKSKTFGDDWSKIEEKLKGLLQADGPAVSKAGVLNDIRDKLAKAAKGKPDQPAAVADAILDAVKSPNTGFQKRAAVLKLMKHFYFVSKIGSQKIWVCAPPVGYSKWVSDELDGKTEASVKTLLKEDTEVFTADQRKLMAQSTTLGRKWSQNAVSKLGGKSDAKTLALVKKWFHGDAGTDDEVKASAATLLAGFKKVSALCNASELIFSDRPTLRTDGWWESTYASVNAGDRVKAMYIYNVFLKAGAKNAKGKIPKLWLCALTVIHEATHKELGTKDHRYDHDGLKPAATADLTPEKALANADSWAYFAVDLAGMLDEGTVTSVYK